MQRLYKGLREHGGKKIESDGNTGLAASTIRKIHGILREAMDAAKRKHLIAQNPTEGAVLLQPERPVRPGGAYRKLKELLESAGLPDIRFHDLRHAFATMSLNHGMDVKTLSMVIGHASAATTLNVYAHITDEMRQSAAVKIDRGIAGVEAPEKAEEQPRKPQHQTFQAKKGKIRKRGTGCVSRLNDHLWEGRPPPSGRTERSTPAVSTRKPRLSARQSWRS